MRFYFQDNSVTYGCGGTQGPGGGTPGVDGNPVGTVISFLGRTAPEGYLVCDGAEHAVEDYPALADFFRQQFGAAGHFGGDGESTFAVPDLRNLFLRGYHGEAEEKLSGDVGEKQEATRHLNISTDSNSAESYIQIFAGENGKSSYPDFTDFEGDSGVQSYSRTAIDTLVSSSSYFTARPVNAAVLYCVKAV
ncbi:phage tail protein [Oscillospiraceae bacterium 38-13]